MDPGDTWQHGQVGVKIKEGIEGKGQLRGKGRVRVKGQEFRRGKGKGKAQGEKKIKACMEASCCPGDKTLKRSRLEKQVRDMQAVFPRDHRGSSCRENTRLLALMSEGRRETVGGSASAKARKRKGRGGERSVV